MCLRQVRGEPIWNALADERVTHLCGAPIVMSLLLSTNDEAKRDLDHIVHLRPQRRRHLNRFSQT